MRDLGNILKLSAIALAGLFLFFRIVVPFLRWAAETIEYCIETYRAMKRNF